MAETIAKLVKVVPTFPVTENGSTVHNYFEQNKETEGVVLVDREKPVGILMRNDFYQKIGRQFGYSLYMKRDVALIMKTEIVCVDISCDLAKFGLIAMNRSKDSLYDHIIVLKNHRYIGTVSMSEYLIEMSRTKEREIELLNEQQRILKQANEAEKQHRMEIEQKNTSIKNLLDNAGQGFLSFNSHLIISGEHSKECDDIFGFSIGSKNFLEILQEYVDSDALSLMKNVFKNVFEEEDKTRNKIYLSLLPQEITIEKKYIKIEYKIIDNLSEKSVMIILTDITEKKALELKNIEEKNNLKLIIRAIGCKDEINQAVEALNDFFADKVYRLLNSGQDKKEILYQIYRTVHTMKGDFSLQSLHHTSLQLHQLEDSLSKMLENINIVTLDHIREFVHQISCDHLLEKDISVITEFLGKEFFGKEDTFTVHKNRLTEIKEEIRKLFRGPEQAALLQLLDSLSNPNIKDIIRNYNDYTRGIAVKMGKDIEDFNISGDDVYINKNRYCEFSKALIHVFRNIIDHGIETPDERSACGKPEAGKITCKIEKYESQFILNISDDGKGIDIDAVRRKAVEKELYPEEKISTLSREEILDTIFLDNFSTKDSVSMLSGRGVGLAAVRSAVEKLGGKLLVETQPGKFTNFKFMVPVING